MHSREQPSTDGVFAYFGLACGLTWLLAAPLALSWVRHATPPPYGLAGAGLSAFGPLIAAIAVAGRQKRLKEVFATWRTNPLWIILALFTPMAAHVVATALSFALGAHPTRWLHPPQAPEQIAALVVFSLGEEFGWRGFAHPRMMERHGFVKGSLLLGALWGLWHLMYSITPTAGTFDWFTFGTLMAELPLYTLLVTWVFERAHRSMAVAIAFHAGAHLDRLENEPNIDVRIHVMHFVVIAVLAAIAAKALNRSPRSAP
jgi:membrane protease YdiL (CAAX protease family)